MLKILLSTPAMVASQVILWVLVITALIVTPSWAEVRLIPIDKKSFKKCVSCHTIAEDGKNKIGPNLWNIFNRGTAKNEDYKYSKKFRAWAEENPVWTPELMDQWLTKSKKLVKGTRMSFREKKEKKRAATIVYLKSMQPEVEK